MSKLFTRGPIALIKGKSIPEELKYKLDTYSPKTDLGRLIREIAAMHLPVDMAAELLDRFSRIVVLESSLAMVHFHGDTGRIDRYGVVSKKVITTTGVGFLVDAWQNSVEMENMKYHGLGTDNTAEASGQTALITELTTQYNPDSTRATGSTTEASATVFRTVGTNTVDASAAIVEHGILSQAATGGGVLWDRSIFSVINLASGDSLQSTYDMTASAGG